MATLAARHPGPQEYRCFPLRGRAVETRQEMEDAGEYLKAIDALNGSLWSRHSYLRSNGPCAGVEAATGVCYLIATPRIGTNYFVCEKLRSDELLKNKEMFDRVFVQLRG